MALEVGDTFAGLEAVVVGWVELLGMVLLRGDGLWGGGPEGGSGVTGFGIPEVHLLLDFLYFFAWRTPRSERLSFQRTEY